jgi:cobalamin biosynthetic protein CobC
MIHHGGKRLAMAQQFGIAEQDWLDLSTGVSPFCYPIPAIPITIWNRLPEEEDGLCSAAAEYYQCPSLLPIAGSQAGIQLLPTLIRDVLNEQRINEQRINEQKPNDRPKGVLNVLLPRVGYKEHQHAWRHDVSQSKACLTYYDDLPTAQQLQSADVVVIINPNNPSTHKLAPAQLLAIRQIMQPHAFLVVDEAFMDITPEASILPMFKSGMPENWVVFRSLGKFFGLAGLRVGFMFATAKILSCAQAYLGPWSLTGPSRFIAKQALQNRDWQQQNRDNLMAAGNRLKQLLEAFFGDVRGHFLFYTVRTPHAPALFEALAKQGILVRLCDERDALRVGLPKNEHDWARLQAALSCALDVAP